VFIPTQPTLCSGGPQSQGVLIIISNNCFV
jgi:hypothetical protein